MKYLFDKWRVFLPYKSYTLNWVILFYFVLLNEEKNNWKFQLGLFKCIFYENAIFYFNNLLKLTYDTTCFFSSCVRCLQHGS